MVQLTVTHGRNANPETVVDADRAAIAAEILNADLYRIKIRGALFELEQASATHSIIESLSSLRRVESFHTVGRKHVVTIHPWRA